MKEIKEHAQKFLNDSNATAVAIATLDFKTNNYESFQLDKDLNPSPIYFDLASLTKPLINSFSFLSEKPKNPEFELLLNHRSGIPSWGLLSKDSFKEDLARYSIKESSTEYSDFGAIRFMLEFEKFTGKSLKEYAFKNLDDEIIYWLDLKDERTVQYGHIRGEKNFGKVHDPNGYNLKTFLPHAGLFGTIDGVAKTLLNFNEKYNLLKQMNVESKYRFLNGFDTISNPSDTLAGAGCSTKTFGHLGFTGTSFWIDPEKEKGHIILSNATRLYWYDKKELNQLRREVGKLVWHS